MTRYAAFLRGINSGRNPTVKMEVLRRTFEGLGLENVKTVLASGNVLFETDSTDKRTLADRIEKVLPGAIGFQSSVIIRSMDDIQCLVESDPFRNTTITPHVRPHVTFTREQPKTDLELPSTGKGYTILGVFHGAVCSVVDLAAARTPDLMQVLEKTLGKHITTRNWNTLKRILAAGMTHR